MRRIQIDYGNTNNIINNLKNIVINLENEKIQIKNALNELHDLENYYNSKGEILRELEYRERQVSKDIEDTEILIENINAFSQKIKEVDENLANKFTQDVAKYSKKNNIEITNELDTILNRVQVALDLAGFIPVVGDICDGINGVISLARGDISGALISFVAMVPFIGDSVKGLKYMDKASDLLKLGDKVVDIGKATAKVEEKKLAKLAKKETLEIISKGEKEFKNVLEATLDLGKNDYVTWIKNKGEVPLNTVTDELSKDIQVCINNGCLVGDTLVKTIDGLKFIKEIKVGDLVLSKNEELGIKEYKKVIEIHKNSTYESCVIKTENSIIEGTTGHLFMIKDKWWTPALEIKENDYIELSNGSYEKIIEVEYKSREYPINTYNLTVADNHNYYTGKDEVLTHNMGRKVNCKEIIDGANPRNIKDILNGGLDVHESMGGHLLEKHVGKSEKELLERLKKQPKISGSSSFSDKNIAEDVCYKILCDKNNKVKINEWLLDSKKGNKLVLDYKGIEEDLIGIGVKRGESLAKDMYNGMIVLKKDGKGGYYILTGYPTK
ncbi:RNase A-like domain-containing protein [Paraclostridium ghonii]|uniref:RNase A-like domain-containing protein n=1 Tax=Paraclostridium ghonii TaxID=29358 RepID=UPI00202CAFD6|nr:RNase A-like domain-containing protein [Paeniclostridium ghonii]MCM0165915.1 hypothetical protein [Paeniclostridium ghonii]